MACLTPGDASAAKRSLRPALRDAPVFRPTEAEFEDPIKFIASIYDVASEAGIAKIVPPHGWKPPFSIDMASPDVVQTVRQDISVMTDGGTFWDGGMYSVSEFRRYAQEYWSGWLARHYESAGSAVCETIENDYWDIVERGQV